MSSAPTEASAVSWPIFCDLWGYFANDSQFFPKEIAILYDGREIAHHIVSLPDNMLLTDEDISTNNRVVSYFLDEQSKSDFLFTFHL